MGNNNSPFDDKTIAEALNRVAGKKEALTLQDLAQAIQEVGQETAAREQTRADVQYSICRRG